MRILILAQWNWHGPARLPWALKKAGAEVALICRKGDLASMSSHVDRMVFADTSQEQAILDALHRTMVEWKPAIVLPGTDNMVGTLGKYRLLVNQGALTLSPELAEVIDNSLVRADREKYVAGKIDLLNELAARGVSIAPQQEIATFGDAGSFVEAHGYPVLLKPDRGFAGQGIRRCDNEGELLAALEQMLAKSPGRFAIQKHLGDQTAQIEFVSRDGRLLASNCIYRLRTYPEIVGVTSVGRIVKGDTMRRAAESMCEFLGYNGFGVAQFMVQSEDCEPAHLIELNPRMSSFPHFWRIVGTDLAGALIAGWTGRKSTIVPPKVGLTFALYPQEAMRDQNSEFLGGLRDQVEDDPTMGATYDRAVEQRRSAIRAEDPPDRGLP